jgi:hypothetical protein
VNDKKNSFTTAEKQIKKGKTSHSKTEATKTKSRHTNFEYTACFVPVNGIAVVAVEDVSSPGPLTREKKRIVPARI